MKLWRTLSLLSLFIFTVSGPVAAQESLLQQQDVGVNITETAVPPAVDAKPVTATSPSHAKKKATAAVSTHKAKKAKAHKAAGKKHHASKAKKHKF
jgi:hypothetical protein